MAPTLRLSRLLLRDECARDIMSSSLNNFKTFVRLTSHFNVRTYATSFEKPAVAGLGKIKNSVVASENKTKLPVEKDPKKLVSHVCGTNLLVEGGEDIKIKSNSEYPDWLWEIHIGKPLTLEEMDPNTKAYWNRVRKMVERKNKYLLTLQKHKTLQK